jgi:hypothetical protein
VDVYPSGKMYPYTREPSTVDGSLVVVFTNPKLELIIYDCILREIHPNDLLRSIQFGALYLENDAMKFRAIA